MPSSLSLDDSQLAAQVDLVPYADELEEDDGHVLGGGGGGGAALAQEEALGQVVQQDQAGEDDDGDGEELLALVGLGAAPLGVPVADEGGEVDVGGVVALVVVLIGGSRLAWCSLGVWSRGGSHLGGIRVGGSRLGGWSRCGHHLRSWVGCSNRADGRRYRIHY